MSTEERVIRPYLGIGGFHQTLRGLSIQAGGENLEAGARISLPTSAFLTVPVTVVLARTEADLEGVRTGFRSALSASGLPAEDVELLVMLTTPRLKLAEITWRFGLDELDALPTHVDLPTGEARPAPLRAAFGGCRVVVYAVLRCNRNEEPLRPWRKGTWLGHASFTINTDLGDVGFLPLPLTDAVRHQLQLPPRTLRYADIDDPLAPESSANGFVLYVDEELLNRLALTPTSPGAKSFQRQLFLDAMNALVLESSRQLQHEQPTVSNLDGSLLGQILGTVAGPRRSRSVEEYQQLLDALLDEVRNRPATFVARVENTVDNLRQGLAEVVTGAER